MFETIIELTYMVGALLIVLGLRKLGSPDTARRGNIEAGIGMGLAILAALIGPMQGASNNYGWILGGMIVGGAIGWVAAKKVKMTAMPQMVSIFNGFGGATAVVLGMVELEHFYSGTAMDGGQLIVTLLALIIGGVSFTGSMLAYLKLDGKVKDKNVTFNGHSILNIILLLVMIAASVYLYMQGRPGGITLAVIVMVISLIYGFSFVAPIGGADMPVVISLLNSFTGLSAAAAGLIYGNLVMIVGGIFVGAAGTILTVLMCNAMNRSLLNVIIGGFGTSAAAGAKSGTDGQIVKEIGLNDLAIQLYYSDSVIFVPGYGLAVAQAQKALKELDDLLTANGVDVKYAIHPVAGRMPGHMNVLLAEADVPYPKLLDLEEANAAFPATDIVVIVGANDVVNPAAKDDPSSPIYGMPILDVLEAKNVVVIKRSMSPGYAGIQNPLFFHPKNKMLFGDAKAVITKVASEVKDL
ncbi:MAG TPA: NAD(P)(+) transhydrogenase (Re/Si-specific) subunit beta [Saprospiraceae bacterium]|nr:NAD(P)(+) transhydrogenase (Re/Si-specific) subunit beta [Saprospiraceae bacterium]